MIERTIEDGNGKHWNVRTGWVSAGAGEPRDAPGPWITFTNVRTGQELYGPSVHMDSETNDDELRELLEEFERREQNGAVNRR